MRQEAGRTCGDRQGCQRGRLVVDPKPRRASEPVPGRFGLDFSTLARTCRTRGENSTTRAMIGRRTLRPQLREFQGPPPCCCNTGCHCATAACGGPVVSYPSESRDMILDPEFHAKGWETGSGSTPANYKIRTAWLMGWGRRNVEFIMLLKALSRSGGGTRTGSLERRSTGLKPGISAGPLFRILGPNPLTDVILESIMKYRKPKWRNWQTR